MSQRPAPDSDVRSSIQSTAVIPASLAESSAPPLGFVPGRRGSDWKADGTGGFGSLIFGIGYVPSIFRCVGREG